MYATYKDHLIITVRTLHNAQLSHISRQSMDNSYASLFYGQQKG